MAAVTSGVLLLLWFGLGAQADIVGDRNPRPVPAACRSFHSCAAGDDLAVALEDKGCGCDAQCDLYGDCCSNAAGAGHTWDAALQEVVLASTCTEIRSGLDNFKAPVVNKCPRAYTDNTTRTLCEDVAEDNADLLLEVPVSEREYGFVFRNIYCSICHGYEDVLFWNVTYKCKPPTASTQSGRSDLTTEEWAGLRLSPMADVLAMFEGCGNYFILPRSVPQPRGCFRDIIDTCPTDWTGAAVAQDCANSAIKMVSKQSMAYKNTFCAQCHGVTRYDCKTPIWLTVDPINSIPASITPLSILLDFNSGHRSINGQGAGLHDTCTDGQIYDVMYDTCRALTCPAGTSLVSHQCVQLEFDFINYNTMGDSPNYTTSACPMVQLEGLEYRVFANGTLFLNETGISVASGRYMVRNDSVFVCARDYNTNGLHWGGHYKIDAAQGILSLVGMIISIIALCLLLLVYGCFKKLRNVPGQCLMCLAGSLLAAQVLFLVGMYSDGVPTLCRSVAILTHFCFLAAFCWMNVMAFDVWKTFHQQYRLSSRSRKINNFIFYSIYAFLVPLIIVVCGIVLDHTEAESVPSPGYGEVFCWISDSQALFFLFVLPVFLLVIVNCVFFAISVYHIYHTSLGTSVLRKGTEGAKRKRVLLYAKLSTIMGLTWVFGFAAALTNNTILWYLFIIFNSLQGLFICLAFICNSKVWGLMSGRISRYSERTSLASSGNTRLSTVDTGSYRKKESRSAPESQNLRHVSVS